MPDSGRAVTRGALVLPGWPGSGPRAPAGVDRPSAPGLLDVRPLARRDGVLLLGVAAMARVACGGGTSTPPDGAQPISSDCSDLFHQKRGGASSIQIEAAGV